MYAIDDKGAPHDAPRARSRQVTLMHAIDDKGAPHDAPRARSR